MSLLRFFAGTAIAVSMVAGAVHAEGTASTTPSTSVAATPVAEAGTANGVGGTVTVARGSKTFKLKSGDKLFPGDRIIAGADGIVNVVTPGCTRGLSAGQAVAVDALFCTKEFVVLPASDLATAAAAAGSGGAIVGGTPALLGLLGAGGAAAAAGGGGGGGTTTPSP